MLSKIDKNVIESLDMFLSDLFKLNNDDQSVLSFNVCSVLTQKYGIHADVVSLSNFTEIITTAANFQ